ncbi:dihydrofolate reductase family protein [Pseudonocardia spirodelae]|uniref:Dihydrofolate reductase family protein n=1 Tax=Pseudonocardia spirodelae TaxID=3133431 RepID=A0ABU8T4X7_9PSEU
MRVLVVEHLTLDGVVQGPGRADEDTRDGFAHGGWATARSDERLGAAMGARMGGEFAWLFGRRSYDGMLSHWNATGGPFRDGLNGPVKYVATSAPESDLTWPNTVRLGDDVPAAVAELRRRPGGTLVVMGSAELVRSLLPHGLVDELFLMIHPVVLGTGRQLFAGTAAPADLTLVDTEVTPAGVVLATYRPAAGPPSDTGA